MTAAKSKKQKLNGEDNTKQTNALVKALKTVKQLVKKNNIN